MSNGTYFSLGVFLVCQRGKNTVSNQVNKKTVRVCPTSPTHKIQQAPQWPPVLYCSSCGVKVETIEVVEENEFLPSSLVGKLEETLCYVYTYKQNDKIYDVWKANVGCSSVEMKLDKHRYEQPTCTSLMSVNPMEQINIFMTQFAEPIRVLTEVYEQVATDFGVVVDIEGGGYGEPPQRLTGKPFKVYELMCYPKPVRTAPTVAEIKDTLLQGAPEQINQAFAEAPALAEKAK